MNRSVPNPQTEQYLLSLRALLAPMTLAGREEILREIAAHIQDSVAESGEPAGTVIARLGPPEDLAAQYSEGILIRRASHSFSPLLLLRATLRLASKGISGVVVFFCGLLGYGIGAGAVLSAFLKPIFPANTGLWVLNGHVVACGTVISARPIQAHEILGWSYIPIMMGLGIALSAVTTYAIRAFLRLSCRWQTRLASRLPGVIPQQV